MLRELAVGATLLAGGFLGVREGVRMVRSGIQEAGAAEAPRPAPHALIAPVEYPVPTFNDAPAGHYFLGVKDSILTAPLETGAITRVKFNRGGSSISLRLDFADGSRAAFKPDQTDEQTVPRREIAAYRLSRLLGIESVSPAIGRKVPLAELLAKLDGGSQDMAARMQAEIIAGDDGMVAGEASWWIPIIIDAKLEGIPLDEPEAIAAWHRYLTVGAAEPYSARHLLPQISNMIVFDYLINNTDRFSGSNAKSSPDGRVLFFMDNTLSFGPTLEGSPKVRMYLEKVQKLSRNLMARVRSLDAATLKAVMAGAGPYAHVIDDDEVAAVMYRRDQLLEYVDGLVAEYGAEQVLVYP